MRDLFLEAIAEALGPPGRWQGKTLLVALSGGVDSTVVLQALHLLQSRHGYTLEAVHVHHGLQATADNWPQHCADLAAARGIPFHLKKIHVEGIPDLGLEGAARQARYTAIGEIQADCVVLGHHLDDQAESVLLQLLRGAGPAGLSGMGAEHLPARHPLHTPILRPLLGLTRAQIVTWAQEQQLQWIEDPSNQSLNMDRNFIRLEVGPVLGRRFQGWRAGLARSAQWAAEAQVLLTELAQLDRERLNPPQLDDQNPGHKDPGHKDPGHKDPVQNLAQQHTILDGVQISTPDNEDPAWLPGLRTAYLTLSEHRLRNLIRVLVAERGAPAPPAPRLIEWIRQLHHAHPDRAPMMIWQDWVLRCWSEKLWLEKRVQAPKQQMTTQGWDPVSLPEPASCEGDAVMLYWDGMHPFESEWAGGGRLELVWYDPEIKAQSPIEANRKVAGYSGVMLPHSIRQDCGPLEIRVASGGTSIQPGPLQPRRELRKLFQEARVPPWRRSRLPMLHCGRKLIAVPGVAVDPAWQAPPGSPGWQLIWRDAGLACYNI